MYHTHGDYSKRGLFGRPVRTSDPNNDSYESDKFNINDLDEAAKDSRRLISEGKIEEGEYRSYLGTPSGKYYSYNPLYGNIEELE
jgi:hypothetical protein